MIQLISKVATCLAPLALLCSLAYGQDIPAVTSTPPVQGFQLPTTLGTLSYSLSFAERVRTGYYGADSRIWGTTASGDIGYLSRSEARPFNMAYSGGYIYNSGLPSSTFQNLSLGQSFITQTWKFSFSDAVSYLPEAASSGLSGIPGVGDVGVTNPSSGPQDILTQNSGRVSNRATANVQKQLTGSTTLQGEGDFGILRFPGSSNGVSSNQLVVEGQLNHRINALTGVVGTYGYAYDTFPGQDIAFSAQKMTVGFKKQLTRKLNVNASGGPEIVFNNAPGLGDTSVDFTGDASVSYDVRQSSLGLTFFRGVRTGSGVVEGTLSTSVGVSADRNVGEFLHLAASGAYSRNSSVQVLTDSPFTFQAYIANFQASRAVARNLNAFLSYSVQDQQAPAILTTINAFSGLSQTVGFGITYSPRQIHLGH